MPVTPSLQCEDTETGEGMFGDRRKGCGQRQTRRKVTSKGPCAEYRGLEGLVNMLAFLHQLT